MGKNVAGYDGAAGHKQQLNASPAAGSGTVSRWAMYCAMRVKSVTAKPTTAGTSNDANTLVAIDGTTTTTLATWTFGSGGTTGTNISVTSTNTIGTNGILVHTKGTDATLVQHVAVEVEPDPLAQLEN